jgi:hypothetical protein
MAALAVRYGAQPEKDDFTLPICNRPRANAVNIHWGLRRQSNIGYTASVAPLSAHERLRRKNFPATPKANK